MSLRYLYIVVVATVSVNTQQWSCPYLENPDFGYVEQTYEEAHYTCDDNYQILGDPDRRCESGKWTGSEPTCWDGIRVECRDLQDPRKGFLTYSDELNNGSVVTYSCYEGFTLIGRRHRSCVNGAWTGSASTCSKTKTKCFRIELQLGQITFSSDDLVPGTSAIHKCQSGYVLQGTNVRTCGIEGFWSGDGPYCLKQSKKKGKGSFALHQLKKLITAVSLLIAMLL